MDELLQMLGEMQIPFAYDHFAKGECPSPPFICFMTPGSDNFSADGVVYAKIDDVKIELYTDKKDPVIEDRVTAVLDSHGIFYEQSEVYITSEKLYEVLFQFQMKRG